MLVSDLSAEVQEKLAVGLAHGLQDRPTLLYEVAQRLGLPNSVDFHPLNFARNLATFTSEEKQRVVDLMSAYQEQLSHLDRRPDDVPHAIAQAIAAEPEERMKNFISFAFVKTTDMHFSDHGESIKRALRRSTRSSKVRARQRISRHFKPKRNARK